MVFAKTSKAASRLSESIRTHMVEKEYFAVVEGIPAKQGILEDYLEKNTKTNLVKVTDKAHGKFARLRYEVLSTKGNLSLVHIHLETGRPHQIRVQFSSRGYPLYNDQRYNPHAKRGQIALWAVRLTFPHPVTKQPVTVTDFPKEPWNGFEVRQYG